MNTADQKAKRRRQQTKTLEYITKGVSVTTMKCTNCGEKLIQQETKDGKETPVCLKCNYGQSIKGIEDDETMKKIGKVTVLDKNAAAYKKTTGDDKQNPQKKMPSLSNEGGM